MEKVDRLVVKVGTAVLTGDAADLDVGRMADLARQIAALRAAGTQVLLVSSGAITAGRARLALRGPRGDIPSRQMLAAVGQHLLMLTYDRLFAPHGITVAQTLLTKADLRDRQGYLNARTTLIGLAEHGVLPVINENDVVAVDEIRLRRGHGNGAVRGGGPEPEPQDERLFGDNDNLAAMVANLVDAGLLVNLTNTGGLYTGDPRHDPTARLIPEVAQITACIEGLAGGAGTEQGTGGMRTKIAAAKLATASGIAVVIAPGAERDVLIRLAAGEAIGTHFGPAVSRREARKRWILSAIASRAALHVDAGAAAAVRHGGRSLLAAGIRDVSGRFGRGDPVGIVGPDGERIACGLVSYDAADVRRIAGHHSQGIADVLGRSYGEEVVHRNNLVVLDASGA
jgi:glutamate 5-kinase